MRIKRRRAVDRIERELESRDETILIQGWTIASHARAQDREGISLTGEVIASSTRFCHIASAEGRIGRGEKCTVREDVIR